jgi:transposase
MTKNTNSKKQQKKQTVKEQGEQRLWAFVASRNQSDDVKKRLTMGIDLGDRASCWCALDAEGEVLARGEVVTERQPLEVMFSRVPASLIAIEVGTHSPWVSRTLEKLGHEVIVANARQVKVISESNKKNDRRDAEFLARLARADRKLLAPIKHRGEAAQVDLIAVRMRAQYVELRTQAISCVRGLVKATGQRLAGCDADNVNRKLAEHLEPAVRVLAEQMLGLVEEITKQIAKSDEMLKQIGKQRYAKEVAQLQQVKGVGPVTALTFVLTLDDPTRFAKSRDVGCYLGLRPKSNQSGSSAPEMRISKEGDGYLRMLLVQCAQYILGKRGPETDLKIWGKQIAAKGKKSAKKRAVVAVARKLAVLLHRLWVSGERYEPLRHKRGPAKAA